MMTQFDLLENQISFLVGRANEMSVLRRPVETTHL